MLRVLGWEESSYLRFSGSVLPSQDTEGAPPLGLLVGKLGSNPALRDSETFPPAVESSLSATEHPRQLKFTGTVFG